MISSAQQFSDNYFPWYTETDLDSAVTRRRGLAINSLILMSDERWTLKSLVSHILKLKCFNLGDSCDRVSACRLSVNMSQYLRRDPLQSASVSISSKMSSPFLQRRTDKPFTSRTLRFSRLTRIVVVVHGNTKERDRLTFSKFLRRLLEGLMRYVC